MSRKIIFLFLSVILYPGISLAQSVPDAGSAADEGSPALVCVDISARNLSFRAVDSYPQRLLKIIRDEDSIKTVRITTFNSYEDQERNSRAKRAVYNPQGKYPSAIARFLKPTRAVNSRSQMTRGVADTLFDGTENTCMDVMLKALSFSKRLVFDAELASALDAGNSMTEPSDLAILQGTGTCSEATNIFLALMRYKGIPARMIVGYCYEPSLGVDGSHAWAECYIEGVGWWAVDPQNGSPAVPYFGYKLFIGRDFRDCRIKRLPDMYLRGGISFKAVKVE